MYVKILHIYTEKKKERTKKKNNKNSPPLHFSAYILPLGLTFYDDRIKIRGKVFHKKINASVEKKMISKQHRSHRNDSGALNQHTISMSSHTGDLQTSAAKTSDLRNPYIYTKKIKSSTKIYEFFIYLTHLQKSKLKAVKKFNLVKQQVILSRVKRQFFRKPYVKIYKFLSYSCIWAGQYTCHCLNLITQLGVKVTTPAFIPLW